MRCPHSSWRWCALALGLGLLVQLGCGPSRPSAEATLDISGGRLALEGHGELTFPLAALDKPTRLTLSVSSEAPPAELAPLTPIYELSPSGLLFAVPVEVRIPLPPGVSEATLYWSRWGAEGFEPVGGTVVDGALVAEVGHFSRGFVGRKSHTRTVSGSWTVTYAETALKRHVPQDLSTATVAAHVPQPDGSYRTLTGSGTADGHFSIPAVPEGPYLLQVRDVFVHTERSVLDLGSHAQGRPNVRTTTPGDGTTLAFRVGNMTPWQEGDRLDFFSVGAGLGYFLLIGDDSYSSALDGPPVGGDTRFDHQLHLPDYDFDGEEPLIEGSRGDRAFLAHLSTRQNALGLSYQALVATFAPAPFDVVAGGSVSLSGDFVPVEHARSIELDVQTSRWMEHLRAIPFCDGPAWAGGQEGGFLVVGQTGGTLAHGTYGNTPDFLSVGIPGSWPDGPTGPLQYGVLPEEEYALYGHFGFACAGHVPYPSGTGTVSIHGSMVRSDTLSALTEGPLVPRLTPPRALRVEGRPLEVTQEGVGPVPLLAWEAPEVGAPNRYQLLLFRLEARTGIRRVATLFTSRTELRLPPGLLQPGEHYTVWLAAEAQGWPRPASPLRSSFPQDRASLTSAPFSP